MNVLIACEESQRVCCAFREKGHNAFSCDIQEPSGGHPEWHILGDALEVLNPTTDRYFRYPFSDPRQKGISFETMDGQYHQFAGGWDLIIAHPPCTYLSNAGACRLYPKKGQIDKDRFEKGMAAMIFFVKMLDADCDKICVENPIPSKIFGLPPYTQIIQPYEYGHPFSKKTCLWLKGLPELVPTEIMKEHKPYVSCGTSRNKGNPDKSGVSRAGGAAKIRSKTFSGIAKAMAEQWG